MRVEKKRDGAETQRDDRERWRKLIQPRSKNDCGKGMRQNKEEDEKRGQGKKKEEGPLAVAHGGTIWHLTTDAHELNKLSVFFSVNSPDPVLPVTTEPGPFGLSLCPG